MEIFKTIFQITDLDSNFFHLVPWYIVLVRFSVDFLKLM